MSMSHRAMTIALPIYWIAIFIATHLPPRRAPQTGIGDKFLHFGAFVILSLLLTLVLRKHRFLATIVICLIYGALDEWTQLLVSRDCELLDWLADVAGAIVGASIGLFILRFAEPNRAR